MGIVPASLAILNSTEGSLLKIQLDNLLLNLDNDAFFSDFLNDNTLFPQTLLEHHQQLKWSNCQSLL
jgi:hypothetical protein